jgi:putative PIG3 family NAD(P)H quinone oxidoreductase
LKYLSVNANQELFIENTVKPEISADECLIKVAAIGVNRADILQRQGKYPAPLGESTILGLEVCGEIVQCGSKVSAWKIKQQVFGLVSGGAYAEYVAIKASQLFKLPTCFTPNQGAAFAEVFLTAFQSLFTIGGLSQLKKENPSVLIHAGASGVGSAAITLAKAKNCFVVVTVGSEEKRQACLALGADVALNYHSDDFVAWSKEHYKTGFDVIIDVVGGDYLQKNISVAALDGHIIILSILNGRFCPQVDIAKMLLKRLTISSSTLRNRNEQYKAELVSDFKKVFEAQLNAGELMPLIDSTYHWHNTEQAHQKMLANKNIGKLVLTIAC